MHLLFLMHSGTNSRSIFLDMLEGARAAGFRTTVLEISHFLQIYEYAPEKRSLLQVQMCQFINEFIKENQVDLSIAMWANAMGAFGLTSVSSGPPVHFFHAIKAPLLQIWLDAPERLNGGALLPVFRTPAVRSEFVFHYINNEASAAEMLHLFGFSNVLPLPYGINPKIFRPYPEEKKQFDLMFSIGGGEAWRTPTPVMLSEIARDEPDLQVVRQDLANAARPQLDAIATHFPQALQPAVREVLEQLLALQLADPTLPMVNRLTTISERDTGLLPAVQALCTQLPDYTAAVLACRHLESFYRVFYFVYLARFFRCAFYGKGDLSAWNCPLQSAGFVAYEEQARLYSQAHTALSIMRWQDEMGLHIKPYEIAASGTACLAQHRVGIEHLFVPEKEIALFTTPASARAKLSHLLENPAELQAIARAGRDRTLRDHTWAVRLRTITGVIAKLRSL